MLKSLEVHTNVSASGMQTDRQTDIHRLNDSFIPLERMQKVIDYIALATLSLFFPSKTIEVEFYTLMNATNLNHFEVVSVSTTAALHINTLTLLVHCIHGEGGGDGDDGLKL